MEMSAFRSCHLSDLPRGCWLRLPWFLDCIAFASRLTQAAHLRFTFRKRHNIDSVIGGSPVISVEWRRGSLRTYCLNDSIE